VRDHKRLRESINQEKKINTDYKYKSDVLLKNKLRVYDLIMTGDYTTTMMLR